MHFKRPLLKLEYTYHLKGAADPSIDPRKLQLFMRNLVRVIHFKGHDLYNSNHNASAPFFVQIPSLITYAAQPNPTLRSFKP